MKISQTILKVGIRAVKMMPDNKLGLTAAKEERSTLPFVSFFDSSRLLILF